MPGRRKVLIKVITFAAAGVIVAAQAIRPARTNPQVDPARTIEHAVPIPPETAAILDRACANCHSNRTEWPWYAHVAPVSWFVIDHVNHARTHLNLSDWARLSPTEADRLLDQMCTLTREGEMPMWSYLLMHDEARLTPQDVQQLCNWAAKARGQSSNSGRQ
jgi:heme-binding protein